MSTAISGRIEFATRPERYRHWKLSIDGRVATLAMDVQEDAPLVPGYELKLNSYDLGVDIELYDAVQRLRFEHPEVAVVVLCSAKPQVFCAGANIRMLARSSHAHKVNFCKFTNETRNSIEDASAHSGQTYVCAVNGTAPRAVAMNWLWRVNIFFSLMTAQARCPCPSCRCWRFCPEPAA